MIIALDIETDVKVPAWPDPNQDRIVSIALVSQGAPKERLVNPGFPLTRTDVHGITDDQVRLAPPFRAIARSLADARRGIPVFTSALIHNREESRRANTE